MIQLQFAQSGPMTDAQGVARLAMSHGMERAVKLVFDRAQARYRGIRRGPGRYGHVAESLRARVQFTSGAAVGRIGPEGRAAFKARFLERGTRMHVIGPKTRRARAARRAGIRPVLAFVPTGGTERIFRKDVLHPPMAARHLLEQTEHETTPDVLRIIRESLVDGLNGSAA